MKLLVFSDSHGAVEPMAEAVRWEQPDLLIHLGDYCRDGEELRLLFPKIPMLQVAGNCDRYYNMGQYPEIIHTRQGGADLYLTHGHRQGVKQSLLRLKLAAQEAGAQVALFGHTHSAYCQESQGLTLMNPGACGSSRGTYGIITIENKTPRCQVVSLADRARKERKL